jgi:multicomponent Na+:H+ antiporter subunit B
VAVHQRHATDVITAVNFDYRAFDTLGEEFILFAAVLGVAVVLRSVRGEHERAPDHPGEDHHFPGTSSSLSAFAVMLAGVALVIGLYIVAHGQITPGGGFQGGVILAAALLGVFLAGEYIAVRVLAPHAMVEVGETIGAAGYALVGLGGLLFSTAFFKNFLELGKPTALLSAGTIPISNWAVGLEVAGAFLVLWTEFFDQALVVRGR